MKVSDKIELAMRRKGYGNIGRRLNVTRQAVSRWVIAGRVPAKHVLQLAAMLDVEPRQIRSDIFPAELSAARALAGTDEATD